MIMLFQMNDRIRMTLSHIRQVIVMIAIASDGLNA